MHPGYLYYDTVSPCSHRDFIYARNSLFNGGQNFRELIQKTALASQKYRGSTHVLLFSFPAQGHVIPFLKLAELLCLASLKVSFLVIEQIHPYLVRNPDIKSHFARFPGFHLESISDGRSPTNPPPKLHQMGEDWHLLSTKARPLLEKMLVFDYDHWPKFSCLIPDGIMGFPIDMANELQIPVITFHVLSAITISCSFSMHELIAIGKFPFASYIIPFLKLAELLCLASLKVTFLVIEQIHPYLVQNPDIKSHFARFSRFHLESIFDGRSPTNPPPKLHQMGEEWHLLSTKARPLLEKMLVFYYDHWPKFSCLILDGIMGFPIDMANEFQIPVITFHVLSAITISYSFSMHELIAIGKFPFAAGVPVIGWPCLTEQHLNGWYFTETFKIGLVLKDYAIDRHIVVRMVNEVMEKKKDEYTIAASLMAILVNKAVNEGGSSYNDYKSLVDHIRLIGLKVPT
ncbi:hypothetical protein Ancab_038696 [Ancistrocladus abbreviatus]